MYINRDFLNTLQSVNSLEVVLLWGPRQVGKTTLIDQISLKSKLFLDDLSIRLQANSDPAFLLDNIEKPCLIDEIQYAPELFPEIKLRVDLLRRANIHNNIKKTTQYYLTGSNKTLLNENVKESLAGRCNIYTLHGLSFREIISSNIDISLKSILFKGSLPELYNQEISSIKYLNDYINLFVEKDLAHSAGINKTNQFQTVLKLLAARTGQFINVNEISNAAGVDNKTIQSWMSLLETNHIIKLLPPYYSNLSKRLVKLKKLYFYDTGICARLQGHNSEITLLNSPQAGSLFETLAFSEIIKTKDNFLKNWEIYCWRTKDKNEIDFIIKDGEKVILAEVKLGIYSAQPFELDPEAKKVFNLEFTQKIVISAGNSISKISNDTTQVPISSLGNYLLENLP